MIHPHAELAMVSPDIGLGLVARQRIPRGTLTWVHDPLDQVLPADFVARLSPLHAHLTVRFAYRDQRGDYVLPWDDTRFMNHSCQHNCALTPFGFEIAIVDILPGEQLSNDYAMLNLEPDERLVCQCGSACCRGVIGPADRLTRQAGWHAEIQAALACAGAVDQALLQLLPAQTLAAAQLHYCPGDAARAPTSP